MNLFLKYNFRFSQPSTSATSITSSTTKQSEDVTPKPVRPQAFAAPMTQFVIRFLDISNRNFLIFS
jgi:hypothetical protein